MRLATAANVLAGVTKTNQDEALFKNSGSSPHLGALTKKRIR